MQLPKDNNSRMQRFMPIQNNCDTTTTTRTTQCSEVPTKGKHKQHISYSRRCKFIYRCHLTQMSINGAILWKLPIIHIEYTCVVLTMA